MLRGLRKYIQYEKLQDYEEKMRKLSLTSEVDTATTDISWVPDGNIFSAKNSIVVSKQCCVKLNDDITIHQPKIGPVIFNK